MQPDIHTFNARMERQGTDSLQVIHPTDLYRTVMKQTVQEFLFERILFFHTFHADDIKYPCLLVCILESLTGHNQVNDQAL